MCVSDTYTKKGDAMSKENYRPVSSLPSASKLLESIVKKQVTDHLEVNNLLPDNQHGFRSGRSTMSASRATQKDWAENKEGGWLTGVLLWDLSAAFDTIDVNILLKKLEILGFSPLANKWMSSFVTDRKQAVRIINCISKFTTLTSGVPQGGILSPIFFIAYVADLENWVKYSKLNTYADDTASNVIAKTPDELKVKLESDATAILKFMASNGLVANPSKTHLLVLNYNSDEKLTIKINGCDIVQTENENLLGITFSDTLKWSAQIDQLIANLNRSFFLIRRLSNRHSKDLLVKVANGTIMSIVRYGLQLY